MFCTAVPPFVVIDSYCYIMFCTAVPPFVVIDSYCYIMFCTAVPPFVVLDSYCYIMFCTAVPPFVVIDSYCYIMFCTAVPPFSWQCFIQAKFPSNRKTFLSFHCWNVMIHEKGDLRIEVSSDEMCCIRQGSLYYVYKQEYLWWYYMYNAICQVIFYQIIIRNIEKDWVFIFFSK